ncbi:short-chain dehydrogenase [Xylogone sp. PMI_703]|nr:short-chain dehydrogenase [Xylogone sp. PMI_703]
MTTSSKYLEVHKNPQGSGDARPTALQIIQDEELEGKWADKVIFITGVSSGIGIETARALHTTGATLYLTARNLQKARDALPDLISSPRVHLLELDLNSLESVRKCAAEFLAKEKKLNVLICNAGVMAPPEGRTVDGFETQFGTNHLAHFLLFNLLKEVLLASSTPEFNSRVVAVSSVGHRWGSVNFDNINLEGNYDKWAGYAQSKTANVWMALEIDRRYGSKGLHALSLHPGGINSGLSRHIPEDELKAFRADPTIAKIYKSPEQGAATTILAATGKEFEGQGGKYLENCSVAEPWDGQGRLSPGYGEHTYDTEGAKKLWTVSLGLVGLKDDDGSA